LQPSTRQALEAYLATRASTAPRAMTCSSLSGGTAQGARPRGVRQIGPAARISWTDRYGGHATPRFAAHLRCAFA
jgi:hypothetical protein